MLQRVGLWPRRGDLVRTFSRGMVQRMAIARALLHDPEVLLLDEPDTGLDPQAAEMLHGLLSELSGQGCRRAAATAGAAVERPRTIVTVTHSIERGLAIADKVMILANGRVAYEVGGRGHDRGRVPAASTTGAASRGPRQRRRAEAADEFLASRRRDHLEGHPGGTAHEGHLQQHVRLRAAVGDRVQLRVRAARARHEDGRARHHLGRDHVCRHARPESGVRDRAGQGEPGRPAAGAGRPGGHLLRQDVRQPDLHLHRRRSSCCRSS